MRQRIFFRTLLGAQFLIFLFLFGSGVYLLWLTRSKAILAEPDAADVIHGLHVGAAVCLGICLFWGASFLGLLRRRPWGWWLGLVANFFVFAVVTYGLFDDSDTDIEDWLIPAAFLLVTIIHILTRPSTWLKPEIVRKPDDESQQSAGSGI